MAVGGVTATNLGEDMRHMEKRYRVLYNKTTDTWRILDTWHESMQKMTNWDADLPDDNPALTIITGAAFTELAMEAARRGILGKAVIPKVSEEDALVLKEEYAKLAQENKSLKEELRGLGLEYDKARSELVQSRSKPPMSERYQLKAMALKGIMQLAGMEDIREIDRG